MGTERRWTQRGEERGEERGGGEWEADGREGRKRRGEGSGEGSRGQGLVEETHRCTHLSRCEGDGDGGQAWGHNATGRVNRYLFRTCHPAHLAQTFKTWNCWALIATSLAPGPGVCGVPAHTLACPRSLGFM